MVKGWADHCSSDEESDIEHHHHVVDEKPVEDALEAPTATSDEPTHETERRKKTFVFPDAPPYVAFVGNLSYEVKTADQLAELLTQLAKETLGVDIAIHEQRLISDRKDAHKPHRGFGYVHVETLDMLRHLMELQDHVMAGRKLQLDTANDQKNRNNETGNAIDGSKFRGGNFKRGGRGNGPRKDDAAEALPPKERPRIKLQPRTKPIVNDNATSTSAGAPAVTNTTSETVNGAASNNNPGSAPARDQDSWHDRRKKEREERRTGRSDRGARGGTRNERTVKKDKTAPATATHVPPAAAAASASAPPKVQIVSNSFAALGLDDSDSD